MKDQLKIDWFEKEILQYSFDFMKKLKKNAITFDRNETALYANIWYMKNYKNTFNSMFYEIPFYKIRWYYFCPLVKNLSYIL